MSLNELLPSVQEMPHKEKLQLMQWLATELAAGKQALILSPDVDYPVWSPYDAHEAAATLTAFLEQEKAAQK